MSSPGPKKFKIGEEVKVKKGNGYGTSKGIIQSKIQHGFYDVYFKRLRPGKLRWTNRYGKKMSRERPRKGTYVIQAKLLKKANKKKK